MAMKQTLVALVVALAVALVASTGLRAQAGAPAILFKLGTFEQGGRTFVGLVLRDVQIVDIARANTAYEAANASAPRLTAPADMKQLIARYDAEWKPRLTAIARTVSSAASAPAYAYQISAVKILPPVRPSVQLNAGGNYVEHEQGIATNQARGAGAPAQLLLDQVVVGQFGREPIVRVGQRSTMCHGRCHNLRPGMSGDQCRTALMPAWRCAGLQVLQSRPALSRLHHSPPSQQRRTAAWTPRRPSSNASAIW